MKGISLSDSSFLRDAYAIELATQILQIPPVQASALELLEDRNAKFIPSTEFDSYVASALLIGEQLAEKLKDKTPDFLLNKASATVEYINEDLPVANDGLWTCSTTVYTPPETRDKNVRGKCTVTLSLPQITQLADSIKNICENSSFTISQFYSPEKLGVINQSEEANQDSDTQPIESTLNNGSDSVLDITDVITQLQLAKEFFHVWEFTTNQRVSHKIGKVRKPGMVRKRNLPILSLSEIAACSFAAKHQGIAVFPKSMQFLMKVITGGEPAEEQFHAKLEWSHTRYRPKPTNVITVPF